MLLPVAMAAGFLMVVQAACNAELERGFERPAIVGVISMGVGFALLLTVALTLGHLVPSLQQTARIPWWAWFGGACGALALLSQPFAAPQLGAATYIGVFVTASTVASVVVDHFGWLHFPEHTAGLGRIVGCAMMIIGVALVSLF
jgi:transporter family-2 protein